MNLAVIGLFNGCITKGVIFKHKFEVSTIFTFMRRKKNCETNDLKSFFLYFSHSKIIYIYII